MTTAERGLPSKGRALAPPTVHGAWRRGRRRGGGSERAPEKAPRVTPRGAREAADAASEGRRGRRGATGRASAVAEWGNGPFGELRGSDKCLDVDRAAMLGELVAGAMPCFLARPPMLGKSLTLSTLKALLQAGCSRGRAITTVRALRERVEWKEHPVILLDFTTLPACERADGCKEALIHQLSAIPPQCPIPRSKWALPNVDTVTRDLIRGLADWG